MSTETTIIGQGMAGFSCAVTLKNRNHLIRVLSQNGGATSVSSGSWDFGPTSLSSSQNLQDCLKSAQWQTILKAILSESLPTLDFDTISSSMKEITQALEPSLPMTVRLERSMDLPTTDGSIKRTFVAQKYQAAFELSQDSPRNIGVLHSSQWRYPSQPLSEQWQKSPLGLSKKWELKTLGSWPWGDDVPLAHLATRLEHDRAFEATFLELVVKTIKTSPVDLLILPPLCLSAAQWQKWEQSIGCRIAEPLCTIEPIAGERLRRGIATILNQLKIPMVTQSLHHTEISNSPTDQMIVATGKLFGGGIKLGYQSVEETALGLPLFIQRSSAPIRYRWELDWTDHGFATDQPWAKLGLWVNENWQPVDETKTICSPHVRACGSAVGGVDYGRHGVGLGLMAVMGRLCGFASS